MLAHIGSIRVTKLELNFSLLNMAETYSCILREGLSGFLGGQ